MTAGEEVEFDHEEENIIQYWYDQGNVFILFGEKVEEEEVNGENKDEEDTD